MILLAIDPGCGHSAAVRLDVSVAPPLVLEHVDLPNMEFISWLWAAQADKVTIECLASLGGASQEVVDTAYWVGRFWACAEFSGKYTVGVLRRSVVKCLLGMYKGNDSEVSAYVYMHYGYPTASEARGTKKNPGVLAGITEHKWQAMGLALATIKADIQGIQGFYWDPLYTTSEQFRNAKQKRREVKARKEERKEQKGTQRGMLVDKIQSLVKKETRPGK